MTLFVYVDNSNVWIEGQRAENAARGIETAGQAPMDGGWRYDFGALYRLACPSTEAIGRSLLIGSRPPANDSLWDLAKREGFEVGLYDRNASNKEKRVDTGIVTRLISDAYEFMKPRVPNATAVLVAGDGDYVPAVEQLKRMGIKVRVVFWTHGLSKDLRDLADEFVALDDSLQALTRRRGSAQ